MKFDLNRERDVRGAASALNFFCQKSRSLCLMRRLRVSLGGGDCRIVIGSGRSYSAARERIWKNHECFHIEIKTTVIKSIKMTFF
jgi:hypothetical protein